MRRQMTVVGIGAKKAGISKKGKAYEFTDFSFIYEEEGTAGHKAETIALSPDVIGGRKISVGDVLDIVCHQYNFKTTVDCIL